MFCERRFSAFNLTDNVVGQSVERSSFERLAAFLGNAFGHFLRSVACERQQQDLFGFANARFDQIASFRGDRAGFPRACAGKHERGVFVRDYGATLFRRERMLVEVVEEFGPSFKLLALKLGDSFSATLSRL